MPLKLLCKIGICCAAEDRAQLNCPWGPAFEYSVELPCCLFYGAVLEFDLLSIGDYGSTGEGCDITCHTVENMVVKFAPVSIGAGCSMRAESVCMPGATMEPCGVLVQGSQVLKGETVPGGEVWSGLPAAFVCAADDDRDA